MIREQAHGHIKLRDDWLGSIDRWAAFAARGGSATLAMAWLVDTDQYSYSGPTNYIHVYIGTAR